MIKAKLNDSLIYGLSDENIKRLKQGKPIKIDNREMGGNGYTFIVYGKTEDDIKKELEKVTGQSLTIQ